MEHLKLASMHYIKLLAVAVLFIFFAGTASNGGYEVGDIARDFSLKNVNGKMVSLADYKDAKGYIIIFTCNTCPVSIMYEDRIIDLDKKFSSEGYQVIAINPNDEVKQPGDSFEKMVIRAKEKGFSFPYLRDKNHEITKAYGATNTPHVYVLDKHRKVVYIGSIDNNPREAASADKLYVEDAIKALEKNETPAVSKTKAIGCTIKWAS